MVWDRIYARDGRAESFEEWGGISYALAAADAAAPSGWSIVPILKVGADLKDRAFDFLRTLERAEVQQGIRIVDRPNNRVELRYREEGRRAERMTGNVGGWTWEELAPIVSQVDALYINFISGFELELEEMIRLRLGYHGPMYADLHSLMLGVDPNGVRTPRPLTDWREWLRCFDAVQVNEDELDLVAHNWGGDPWRFAAEMVNDELKLLLVTLAERGAAYVASPAFCADPMQWRPQGLVRPTVRAGGGAETRHIVPTSAPEAGDPTGCGDVWGATCFCRLLGSASLEEAMMQANHAAARNVQHRGANGLNHFLRGRFTP
jgi:sugar/nucleoside kinase (ribokinase family)